MAKKILVADDEADVLEVVSDSLSGAGYEVVAVVNGQEALDRAFQVRPDLIVLDLKMPVMGGREVCRRVKGDEGLKGTPVIIITASSTPGDIEKIPYDACFFKPFEITALLEKVREFLD